MALTISIIINHPQIDKGHLLKSFFDIILNMEPLYLALLYLLLIILIYQDRKKLKRISLTFLKNGRGWLILTLVASSFALLIDGRIWLQKNDAIAELGEKLGNGNYLLPALTTLTYSSHLLGLRGIENTLREALISGVLSGIIADVIKVGSARGRPKVSDPLKWFNYENITDSDYWSFPSGHTALSAGVFFSLYLKARGIFKLPFLMPPILTALSRVMSLSHWPSDVAFSLILGFLIAKGGKR